MLGTGYFLKIAKINSPQEKPICSHRKNQFPQNTKNRQSAKINSSKNFVPHGSQRKKKLILSSDYFLAFTPGRFETAPQVCPMLYMHVLVRKCPFNGCIRDVLSSYKTSLFYLSKFAIRRLAPLFQVKSEEGDFTARKQQKWTTCKKSVIITQNSLQGIW